MPTETGASEQLARLTALFVSTYELIRDGKRPIRSMAELFTALQLFKEGRLDGIVMPYDPQKPTEGARRRAALKERVAREGLDEVWREFLERLTPYTRNRIDDVRSFPDLLRRLARDQRKFFFHHSLGRAGQEHLRVALDLYGLSFEMSEGELYTIFNTPF